MSWSLFVGSNAEQAVIETQRAGAPAHFVEQKSDASLKAEIEFRSECEHHQAEFEWSKIDLS
jgi:hypothetical protein